MNMKILLTGSIIALGAALTFTTPASAQAVCDLATAGESGGGAVATGTDSLACGPGANAGNAIADNYAIAIGGSAAFPTNAFGFSSVAIGAETQALGLRSTALGTTADATADYSTAVGYNALAAGISSTAVGDASVATSADDTALGRGANTGTGGVATAVGANATATGRESISIGGGPTTAAANASTASAHGAIAIGGGGLIDAGARASGEGSIAIGGVMSTGGTPGAVASGSAAIALGNRATADFANSIAIGVSADVGGAGAVAIGLNTDAVANAVAIGTGAQASGTTGVAIGNAATNAGFANSVAIGNGTANTAANQVAVGGQTVATARLVTGVSAGTLSATSFDAVNGSQLFATNTNVTNNTAAIAALGGRVTTLEALAVDFDNRLDRLDNEVAAAGAVASALSGAAFIPGKGFNITGNVATYDGAYAGAILIGALIGDNMAFTAGVSHGFNKGGKTAARAGITFGW